MEELQARHRSLTEQLIRSYRDVLDVLRSSPDGGGRPGTLDDAFTLAEARAAVERAGGFDAQLADIEAVAAHAGGNHTPLVERFFRVDRPDPGPAQRDPQIRLRKPAGVSTAVHS